MKFINVTDVIIIRFFNFFGYLLLIKNSLSLLNFISKQDILKVNNINIENFKNKRLLVLLFTFYISLIMNTTLSIYRDIWIYLLSIKELVYLFFKKI